MNDSNPFGHDPTDNDLADRIHRQARSLDIGHTPIAAVVQRGQQRRERRRVAVGLATILVLSGTAIGSIQLLSQPTTRKVVPGTDSEPSATTPNATIAGAVPSDPLTPVNRIDSNLAWNVVEPGSTEALGSVTWDNSAVASQQPPYLAWSTSPGKTANQEFVPTLYRSDDGIHWVPAGGDSFTQPEISMRGVGSRNGRMFAFGTAAATAPIPNGGGGEVVVDVSDDLGASWRNITLPIDLRGLASSKGVQSVGFQGDMVAGDKGVVAVGVPSVNLDPSLLNGSNGGFIAQRDGAILVNYPTCGGDVTPTTISFPGGYAPPLVPIPTIAAPANTIPAGATTTTNVGTTGTAPVDQCPADTSPGQSGLIPWSDLGIDSNVVAAMFTPRVFVSTDGENFEEGSFPPLPDGSQLSQLDVVATANGFAATATLYGFGPVGGPLAKLYTSTDGLSWGESDMPSGYYNIINVLTNGTIVAFGSDIGGVQPFTAVSTDGVEWSKVTLGSLVNPDDGQTAQMNVWVSGAGPGGITAVAGIDVDAAAEAGGFSIDKDGVRLTMTQSRVQVMVATDIATGEELGRFDGRTPPDDSAVLTYATDSDGGFRLLSPDGTVRVRFTDADIQGLYQQQAVFTPKTVVLHSTDGMNWSRDDVAPLVGFDSFGAGRVQVTDSNVLISIVDINQRDAAGIPQTVVLVGTSKS
jgi:hypothetical protein